MFKRFRLGPSAHAHALSGMTAIECLSSIRDAATGCEAQRATAGDALASAESSRRRANTLAHLGDRLRSTDAAAALAARTSLAGEEALVVLVELLGLHLVLRKGAVQHADTALTAALVAEGRLLCDLMGRIVTREAQGGAVVASLLRVLPDVNILLSLLDLSDDDCIRASITGVLAALTVVDPVSLVPLLLRWPDGLLLVVRCLGDAGQPTQAHALEIIEAATDPAVLAAVDKLHSAEAPGVGVGVGAPRAPSPQPASQPSDVVRTLLSFNGCLEGLLAIVKDAGGAAAVEHGLSDDHHTACFLGPAPPLPVAADRGDMRCVARAVRCLLHTVAGSRQATALFVQMDMLFTLQCVFRLLPWHGHGHGALPPFVRAVSASKATHAPTAFEAALATALDLVRHCVDFAAQREDSPDGELQAPRPAAEAASPPPDAAVEVLTHHSHIGRCLLLLWSAVGSFLADPRATVTAAGRDFLARSVTLLATMVDRPTSGAVAAEWLARTNTSFDAVSAIDPAFGGLSAVVPPQPQALTSVEAMMAALLTTPPTEGPLAAGAWAVLVAMMRSETATATAAVAAAATVCLSAPALGTHPANAARLLTALLASVCGRCQRLPPATREAVVAVVQHAASDGLHRLLSASACPALLDRLVLAALLAEVVGESGCRLAGPAAAELETAIVATAAASLELSGPGEGLVAALLLAMIVSVRLTSRAVEAVAAVVLRPQSPRRSVSRRAADAAAVGEHSPSPRRGDHHSQSLAAVLEGLIGAVDGPATAALLRTTTRGDSHAVVAAACARVQVAVGRLPLATDARSALSALCADAAAPTTAFSLPRDLLLCYAEASSAVAERASARAAIHRAEAAAAGLSEANQSLAGQHAALRQDNTELAGLLAEALAQKDANDEAAIGRLQRQRARLTLLFPLLTPS